MKLLELRPLERWFAEDLPPYYRWFVITGWILAVAAAASLIIDYGFELSPAGEAFIHYLDLGILAVFIIELALGFLLNHNKRRFLVRHAVECILILVLVAEMIYLAQQHPVRSLHEFFETASLPAMKSWIIAMQIIVAGFLFARAIRFNQALLILKLPPPLVVVLSFIVLIGVGTLLLALPRSAASGESIGFVDALFTATSASCVTGLIVQDTATDFSRSGQVIILVLLQLGGLGIMTLASAFALILGRGMGLRESAVMQDILHHRNIGEVRRLVVAVVLLTLALELAGAVWMYFTWNTGFDSWQDQAFASLFHSVSAFCNAGFSTFPDSLANPRATFGIHWIVAALIVIGGLGFMTLGDLAAAVRRWRRGRPVWNRFSLQSKMILTSTAVLILVGALLIGLLSAFSPDAAPEFANTGHLVHHSLFQSITARTAGFNTVDLNALGRSNHLILIGLMFIGAAPGSTAGGIKVVTFVVFLAAISSILQRRGHVELFGRRISQTAVRAVLAVTVSAMGIVFISIFLLLITEPDRPFMELAFEAVSAFGTVGLSLGVTPDLSTLGKLIIIGNMFIGRVGFLTLILALGRQRQGPEVIYPEEQIMIG